MTPTSPTSPTRPDGAPVLPPEDDDADTVLEPTPLYEPPPGGDKNPEADLPSPDSQGMVGRRPQPSSE